MNKIVEIIDREVVFQKLFFRIEEARLRYERFDGRMSREISRLNFDRRDSAAALVHDASEDHIVLTKQFRFSTYDKGPGWILELPAGVVEEGEDPQRTMLRELVEEIGYEAETVQHIATVYVSPGGTSERIHIFYIAVSSKHRTSAGGGLENEGEDIEVVSVPTQEAFDKVANGEIVDAKTVIALQWLQLNLRSK